MGDTERLRILITGPSLEAVSGVSTHVRQLLGSRLATEFELLHFQIGREGRDESAIKRPLRLLRDYLGFASIIARRKPHLIHLNPSMDAKSFWRDLLFLLIAKILRQKVIYQVHGGENPQRFFRSRFMGRFLNSVLGLPHAIVVLGSIEKKAYGQLRGLRHLAVIPNAIDITPYELEKDRASETTQLVYIGRLIDSKGVAETLDALELILLRDYGSLPAIRFSIAGSGPGEEKLRSRARSAPLSEVVTFLGPIFNDQKLEFWRTADIFVFPTYHQEGLPYAILESLASGTPMITTPIGNIPDAVEHGLEGLLVKPKDPAAVADALVELLTNPDRLREMSENCRRTARERFAVDRLAHDFSSLYRRMLGST